MQFVGDEDNIKISDILLTINLLNKWSMLRVVNLQSTSDKLKWINTYYY